MKTNSAARKVRKLQIGFICLALAGLAALELTVGTTLAARFGQTSVRSTQGAEAPNVSLSDVMFAMK